MNHHGVLRLISGIKKGIGVSALLLSITLLLAGCDNRSSKEESSAPAPTTTQPRRCPPMAR